MTIESNSSISLIKSVSNLIDSNYKKIQNDEIDGFIKSENGRYYISFLIDTPTPYLDQFVGFIMQSGKQRLSDGSYRPALFLSAPQDIPLNQFAYIGCDFLKKSNRNAIIKNPYEWSDIWRSIFGDSIKKELTASILGEMIALKYIFSEDKTAKWLGTYSSSQDIICQEKDVEVKTTLNKKDTNIIINNALQLGGKKKQKLYFVRMEAKPTGNSIDSIEKELVSLGYSEDKIENALKEKDLPKGIRARSETYDLLEIKSFDVNNKNFPLFSLQTLNKLIQSKNIIDYTLKIDLTNCGSKQIYSKKK